MLLNTVLVRKQKCVVVLQLIMPAINLKISWKKTTLQFSLFYLLGQPYHLVFMVLFYPLFF